MSHYFVNMVSAERISGPASYFRLRPINPGLGVMWRVDLVRWRTLWESSSRSRLSHRTVRLWRCSGPEFVEIIAGAGLPTTQRFGFDLELVVERLVPVGVAEGEIARLEWFFLPLLSQGRRTPALALHWQMARDPPLLQKSFTPCIPNARGIPTRARTDGARRRPSSCGV